MNPTSRKQGLQIVIHDARTGETLNTIHVDQTQRDRSELSLGAYMVQPSVSARRRADRRLIPYTRARAKENAHGLGRRNRETVVFC